MKATDYQPFVKWLTTLAELYNKSLSPALLQLYWHALQRFSLAQVQAALQQHVVNPDVGQYWCKPSDIVRYITGTADEQALLAWYKVKQAIQQVGCYGSLVFDDAIIHAVIKKLGGWVSLCQTPEHSLDVLRHQFERTYRYYLTQPVFHYPPQIQGKAVYSHHNPQHLPEKPAYIGNPTKAQYVYDYAIKRKQHSTKLVTS